MQKGPAEEEQDMDVARFDRLTRRLAARTSRRTALGATVASVGLGLGRRAVAGQATAEADEEPVFLFVQTAMSGRGEANPTAGTPTVDGTPVPGGGAPFLLTLEGHSGQTIYFSDRPDRIAGSAPTQNFLDGLGFTPENPPNAALVAEFEAGQGVVVMELFHPTYDSASGMLTYGAEGMATFVSSGLEPVARDLVVERLPAEFGPASLFIDDCGAYQNCYYTSFTYEQKYEYHLCGPIPGGPYKECWNLFAWGCVPCKDAWTYDELVRICQNGYTYECRYPGA